MFDNEKRRIPRGVDHYRDVWHRTDSLKRFLGQIRASKLKMIDLDVCEFCPICREPYALKETKHVDERRKFWHVTRALGLKAKLPGHLVVYTTGGDDDIEKFEVTNMSGVTQVMSPDDYAEWLWKCLRHHLIHSCKQKKKAQELLSWEM